MWGGFEVFVSVYITLLKAASCSGGTSIPLTINLLFLFLGTTINLPFPLLPLFRSNRQSYPLVDRRHTCSDVDAYSIVLYI